MDEQKLLANVKRNSYDYTEEKTGINQNFRSSKRT